MDRRAYLGAVITGVLAGCGDVDPDDEPTPTPTDAPADGDTPTPTPTPTDDTPADTPVGDDPDDEADAELTEDERVALEWMTEGDELLGDALRTYADSGSADSFLQVRGSATRFRWVPTANRVREANERFEPAERRASDGQRARLDDLRKVAGFIRESARTQAAVGPAFGAFREVLIAHQGDVISTVAWNRLRDKADAANERMQALSAMSDPDVADASEQLSSEEYAEKVEQLTDEGGAIVAAAGERRRFTEGHRAWLEAEDGYRRGSWSRAEREFGIAMERFDSVAERLDREPVGDVPFDRAYQTFQTIARILADAAVEYEASAHAYGEWERGRNRQQNRETGDERRRAGRRILRNEDAVTEMPSARRLENYDGP